MSIIRKKIVKPYYKIYPYRVRMTKLGRFFDEYLQYSINGVSPNPERLTRMWGFPYYYVDQCYPKTQEELEHRLQVANRLNALCLSSNNLIKLRHTGEGTILYAETKSDYIKAYSIAGDYALELNEPIVENIKSVIDKLGSIEELRTCLYYNKYIYKIHMYAGWNCSLDEICNLRDQLNGMNDILMNYGFNRLPRNPIASAAQIRSGWRYAKYAVACNDEETASYISFIAGDHIVKITKAVIL